MSNEQRHNEGTGEAGYPRENPPTSGIARHDSHIQKSGNRTRFAQVREFETIATKRVSISRQLAFEIFDVNIYEEGNGDASSRGSFQEDVSRDSSRAGGGLAGAGRPEATSPWLTGSRRQPISGLIASRAWTFDWQRQLPSLRYVGESLAQVPRLGPPLQRGQVFNNTHTRPHYMSNIALTILNTNYHSGSVLAEKLSNCGARSGGYAVHGKTSRQPPYGPRGCDRLQQTASSLHRTPGITGLKGRKNITSLCAALRRHLLCGDGEYFIPPFKTTANVSQCGAAGAKRLAHSPPTKANRMQSPAGSPDFRMWESCRDAAGLRVFSEISHFPRASTPTMLHTHLASPSSALKISISRAAQISSLAH
ncbi:hypothetical protein PR048_029131 [Dryococelus australis]|uniref:Uncharacterized protein n=1 Tax=Dryococelus australis TaxID=614101 RepID=A0ABQ9GFV2_9NEOP|nr:hypothetical protein PR048_029131 [Dryococelus australis]